jgi:hypothetical protein|tara:strand:- start:1481 stop:1996 length:516 start_codon:yes stop_codon:yes gene_type:complete
MRKQLVTTVEQFNGKLKSFVKAVKTSQNAARECSNFAILHFEKCGDIGPAQRFYDVLRSEGNSKFLKRDGFLIWLASHAPITIEKNVLLKDKSKDAQKFNTVAAIATPYWMYSRDDDEAVAFFADDVWKEVKRVFTKYSGDKYVAENDEGNAAVNQIGDLLKQRAPGLMVD